VALAFDDLRQLQGDSCRIVEADHFGTVPCPPPITFCGQ
jgi:hypothetical protein